MSANNHLSSIPKKVGIIYSDVKREYFPTEAQYITEKDAKESAVVIAKYLEKFNIKPKLFPGNSSLPQNLRKERPDMVFNLVDSVKGNEYLSSTIPGVLELLEIPYTGAGIVGLSLTFQKFLTFKLLEQNGIPVPRYQIFTSHTDYLNPTLRYPLIAKLNEIHGGVEITKDSVSDNEKHLKERIKCLISTYNQQVLVQEFIVGREINAILLEGLNKKVYMAEKVFSGLKDQKYSFLSFEDQWLNKDSAFHYQKFEDPVLREYVKKAFDVVQMADYGKFDIRLDSSGRYYFIDSNANCYLSPSDSAISSILTIYKVRFNEVLRRLLINTMLGFYGKELLA